MKKVKLAPTVIVLAFLSLSAISCNDSKKEHVTDTNAEMNHNEMNASSTTMDSDVQNAGYMQVLADYMTLKDGLVATNENDAAKAGEKLKSTLKEFSVGSYTTEEQKELLEIIEVAMEHAEHISRSDIDHQREHFKMLSVDITDMVDITGTDNTLYQQFCPMYDDGGTWLSMEKEIANPYYGSKMMNCGEVQKEIN